MKTWKEFVKELYSIEKKKGKKYGDVLTMASPLYKDYKKKHKKYIEEEIKSKIHIIKDPMNYIMPQFLNLKDKITLRNTSNYFKDVRLNNKDFAHLFNKMEREKKMAMKRKMEEERQYKFFKFKRKRKKNQIKMEKRVLKESINERKRLGNIDEDYAARLLACLFEDGGYKYPLRGMVVPAAVKCTKAQDKEVRELIKDLIGKKI